MNRADVVPTNDIKKQGPKQQAVNRRQREQVERSALKSALHLRLPRPTAAKAPSPMSPASELMWDVPSWSSRHRRKSNPALNEPPTTSALTSNRKEICRSCSQPAFGITAALAALPNHTYAGIPGYPEAR